MKTKITTTEKLPRNKSCLLIVTIAILLMIFVGSKMFAQSHDKGQLALSIQQDLKFATIGDNKIGISYFVGIEINIG